MPRIPGMSDAQSKFLRAFIKNPCGPNASDWPSAAVLRRWLRRAGFVAAMETIQVAVRWQGDYQLLSAATAASNLLHSAMASRGAGAEAEAQASADVELSRRIKALVDVMKLNHVRERFNAGATGSLPQAVDPPFNAMALLRMAHPDAKVGWVLDFLATARDRAESDSKAKRKRLEERPSIERAAA